MGNTFRLLQHVITALLVLRLINRARRVGIVGLVKESFSSFVASALTLPGVGGAVQAQIKKEMEKIEQKILGDGDEHALLALPANRSTPSQVIETIRALKEKENFSSGKKWAGIYHDVTGTNELEELQSEVWSMYNNSNSLYPEVFPSLRKFEAEIVQMYINLLHGDSKTLVNNVPNRAVGLLTSGGTESILLAVLAYREWATSKGIDKPSVICSRAAHGALDKACHYFGVTLIKLEVDRTSLQLTPALVGPHLSDNTIAVYCSAPSFPHGVVDDVEGLARLCKARGVGLHVDNCLGGVYLSFLKQANIFKRKFDFELDGVTTISIDVHKYAFSPKGASVVCFASTELRKRTLCAVTDGLTLYVTPTMQGSRSGAVIAAAWATLVYHGQQGYREAFAQLWAIHERVQNEVRSIEGLKLLTPTGSDAAVVAIGSDRFDIFALATRMEEKGWNVFTSMDPDCVGLCYGQQHLLVIDQWLADLRECAAYLCLHPSTKAGGDAAVYGAAKALPRAILTDVLRSYIDVKMTVKEKPKH